MSTFNASFIGRRYFYNDDSTIMIQYSQFDNNHALRYGGSIHSDDRNYIILSNSTGNYSKANDGGAIKVGNVANSYSKGIKDLD